MIEAKGTVQLETFRVVKAVDKGAKKTFAHAAASLRKRAIESIEVTKETIGWITTNRLSKRGKRIKARIFRPSEPGTPVHSHRNKGFVRRGIAFFADVKGAIIGFTHSTYGEAMRVHEFGGERKGQRFDKRPTMFPALEQIAPFFAADWRGSIGE